MKNFTDMDYRATILFSSVLLLLMLSTAGVEFLRRQNFGIDPSVLDTCRARIRTWWLLFGSLICVLLLGTAATVFLFGLMAFWALREYITLTPTRPADHRTLVWIFFLWTPIQFLLVGLDNEWFFNIFGFTTYQVFSVFLPTYAFLILPASIAVSGDPKRFLERIAKIQVGLLICVYSLSYTPAILTTTFVNQDTPVENVSSDIFASGLEDKMMLPLENTFLQPSDSREMFPMAAPASDTSLAFKTPHKKLVTDNLCLLFVFVILVQLSDIFQYLWQQVFHKHKIAPTINSGKTYEGVLFGALSTSFVATLLWYFTPFDVWWKPAILGFLISIMGFAGSITMSAIKRDRGVRDYGSLIEGHNGILDRIDSLCFAAPIFYHCVWIFLNV